MPSFHPAAQDHAYQDSSQVKERRCHLQYSVALLAAGMALDLAIPKLSWVKTNSELCRGPSTNSEDENRIMKPHSLLLLAIVAAALSLMVRGDWLRVAGC